ncbi:MAG: HDOD domain-containing protein [Candidatus Latescibacteria bacterium]|nr:HDOD domain-containing protein [Candidatus Latescibacterota bacterium]
MNDSLWAPQFRDELDSDTVKMINTVLAKIPQLSISVRKIIEMAGDENVNAVKLAEVASSDPVLASKILMIVNSSYYSLNHKVDNLRLAIVLLGFNEVRNIAVQLGFMKTMSEGDVQKSFDTKSLWIHSYLVSVCSESFCVTDDPKRTGVLMTMGILHDIGKFALYSVGVTMKKMGLRHHTVKEVSPDAPLLAKEESLFGVNHATIGGMLAERWNLSDRTRDVLQYHHFPSFYGINEIKSDYVEDIASICLADLIVNHINEEYKKLPQPHPVFFNILGFKPPLEDLITPELRKKIAKAGDFINTLT